MEGGVLHLAPPSCSCLTLHDVHLPPNKLRTSSSSSTDLFLRRITADYLTPPGALTHMITRAPTGGRARLSLIRMSANG